MQTLSYQAGNEHNPQDPFGRVALEVDASGDVRLDHHPWSGGRTRRTARVGAAFLAELAAALDTAGFPAAPQVMPYPGERVRGLTITDGSARPGEAGWPAGGADLLWYDVYEMPGYGRLFRLLDGLAAALGGPDTGAPALDPLPEDVRPVD